MNSITLNIGMAVGTAGTENTLAHTVQAVERAGFSIEALRVVVSDTERTAVVQCVRTGTGQVAGSIYGLAVTLGQDCIAAHNGIRGVVLGPQAAAWSPFKPEFFFNLDGQRMAPVSLPLAA